MFIEWVSLHNNKLTGTIPSEVGLLSKLTGESSVQVHVNRDAHYTHEPYLTFFPPCIRVDWFSLSNNSLTGPIPSEIGLWTSLSKSYLFGFGGCHFYA